MRLVTAALITCVVAPAQAAFLSEDEATLKAVSILRGDVYGDTRMSIVGDIKETRLIEHGASCPGRSAPVWAFHVRAPFHERVLDGWLYLDAASGDYVCSTVPFIR